MWGGIPFLTLGYLVSTVIDQIGKKTTSLWVLLALLMCIGERYVLEYFSLNGSRNVYIATIFLAVSVFIWFYKNDAFFRNGKLALWGKKYSLYIYIIHIAFRTAFTVGNKFIGVSNEYILNLVEPVFVIACSFASAVLCYGIIKKNESGWQTIQHFWGIH